MCKLAYRMPHSVWVAVSPAKRSVMYSSVVTRSAARVMCANVDTRDVCSTGVTNICNTWVTCVSAGKERRCEAHVTARNLRIT